MKEAKKSKARKKARAAGLIDLLSVLGGAALFGIGINAFLLPNDINVGGASGLATLISHFTPIPIGVTILLLNVPLLILSVRASSWRSMVRTVIGTVAVSVSSDLFALLFEYIRLPMLTEELFLSAVLGSGAMGLGSGIMMLRGYTSGGSDLAAYLLHRRVPRISTGRTIFVIDVAVIAATAITLGKYDLIVYCLISSVVYGFAIDQMMRGANDCRCAMIISEKHTHIAKAILETLERGVTELSGKGGYTGESRTVLMCVVRRREEFALRRLVVSVDPKAFVIMTSSCEAIGDGFSDG